METAAPSRKRGVVFAVVGVIALLAVAAFAFHALVIAPVDAGDDAFEREDFGAALDHYRSALRWSPNDAYTHYSMGWSHWALGDKPAAIAAFDIAVSLEPEDASYQFDRIQLLIDMERIDAARAAFETVRGIEGFDPDVLRALEESLPSG